MFWNPSNCATRSLYSSSRISLSINIFSNSESGASGCGCSASVLSGHVLPKMKNGVLKSVLALSTGALMSPTSVQQGETIPGIAHLICFSTEKGGIF
ncbi:MAG: hypothetical protein IIX33_03640 [Oscillospiraceae bacterium]|nr:hypothetical protein [Oscillospiraceae bacterium]